MIICSTNNTQLPHPLELKKRCQSLALLDAILSPEWEYRYYSYNKQWSEEEEFFQMRDGQGDEMLVLFTAKGTVINGFAHELYDYEEQLPKKEDLTANLPQWYAEFIFGEPVASIGTTYCIWTDDQQTWTIGKVQTTQDGSEDQLYIFDGQPKTYIDWAMNYYFDEEEEALSPEMIKIIEAIYNHIPLTKEMVLCLNTELEDWEQLKEDLEAIAYPYTF